MTGIPLLQAFTSWYCPNCPVTDYTPALPPGSSRYHTCAGLHSLSAPLVPQGTRCKVVAEVRQDYLNGDIQTTGDDGVPYMAVRAIFDDYDDVLVNAGLAHAEMK